MIVGIEVSDIFLSAHKNIVFCVNTNGENNWGFPEVVARRASWPSLRTLGKELGNVTWHNAMGRRFHAISAYSYGEGGWMKTPQTILEALNGLDIPKDEIVGMVLPGGNDGAMYGANVIANMDAVAKSFTKVILYTLG